MKSHRPTPVRNSRFTLAGAAAAGILLVGGTLLLSSCAILVGGAAVGAATAYVKGDLESHVAASMPKSIDAVHRAIYAMRLQPVSRTGDNRAMTFIARDARDQKIKIDLRPEDRKVTKILIRVDVFGDEELSRAVLAEVQRQL